MKKVSSIEVKRCFVVSDMVGAPIGRKRYLDALTREQFAKRLEATKKKVLRMSEQELDAHISPNYRRRLRAYNTSEWSIVSMSTKQLGVWRGAGGLSRALTDCSLADTVKAVKAILDSNSKGLKARALHAIPNMLATNVGELQKEKYLLPIVFQSGTGTNGRRGLRTKVKGDIDDGCMRSIALAVAGKKEIKVYFGTPIQTTIKPKVRAVIQKHKR